jgi:iron complex outermembrane receptor protein
VLDAEARGPLAGAAITIRGTAIRAESAEDGSFALTAPAGPFTLVIAATAHEPWLGRIDPATIAPDSVVVIRVTPIVFQGEGVVVTASRYGADVHLSQTNIPRETIQQQADVRDIPTLLEDTPGVNSSNDSGNGVGYTYLNIRGFDQQRIGVMINGIPLNDPEDQQVYWVDMPDLAESLEDIQVQRGITNSLGGMTAIGGTVNLITELLDPQRNGRLTLETGSFGTAKQSLDWQSGLLGGKFATGLRITHLASDGYRQRSGADQWAAFWSGKVITPRTELQANVYTGHEIAHQAWDGIDLETLARDRTANPETYSNAIDDFRQPHYELHHKWVIADRVLLEDAAFVIHGEGYYENHEPEASAHDYSLDYYLGLPDTAQVGLVRRLWVRKDQVGWVPQLTIEHQRGRLIAGGDWYTFHSNHWGDVIAVDGFPGDAAFKFHDFTGKKVAWSAYLNERWRVAGGLTALADLQYQHKRYDFLQNPVGNFQGDLLNGYRLTYDWFNPKGGLFWQTPGRPLGGELGVYGHVGVARREPADHDIYDTWLGPEDLGVQPLFGNSRPAYRSDGTVDHVEWSDPLVKPERVVNWESGVSWRVQRVSLTLDGYWMNFAHEIVPLGGVDENGFAVRGNADRTFHRGIEAGLTAKIAARHTLTAALSRSWNEFDRFITYENSYDDQGNVTGIIRHDYAGHPIALFPNWLGTVGLRSDWKGWDTTVRARSVGRQYLDDSGDSTHTIAPYLVLDLGIGVDLARPFGSALSGARAELKVRNVLDAKYSTYGYYDPWGAGNYVIPAATRNWLLGVRYQF